MQKHDYCIFTIFTVKEAIFRQWYFYRFQDVNVAMERKQHPASSPLIFFFLFFFSFSFHFFFSCLLSLLSLIFFSFIFFFNSLSCHVSNAMPIFLVCTQPFYATLSLNLANQHTGKHRLRPGNSLSSSFLLFLPTSFLFISFPHSNLSLSALSLPLHFLS